MTRTVITVPPDLSITKAVDDFIWQHHVSSFPVLEGDRSSRWHHQRGPREAAAPGPLGDDHGPRDHASDYGSIDGGTWRFTLVGIPEALPEWAWSPRGLGSRAAGGLLSIKDITHLISVSA
jgi:CBS domain